MFPRCILGDRLLSGVWHGVLTKEDQSKIYGEDETWVWDVAETWQLLLDGRLFRISEDPSDGYRSMCRDIKEITDMMPVNWWQASEPVCGRIVTQWPGWTDAAEHHGWWLPAWDPEREFGGQKNGWYDVRDYKCEMVVYVSRTTGKPVCIFGTDQSDDYYPSFIAQFHPQNMGINAGIVDITGRSEANE